MYVCIYIYIYIYISRMVIISFFVQLMGFHSESDTRAADIQILSAVFGHVSRDWSAGSVFCHELRNRRCSELQQSHCNNRELSLSRGGGNLCCQLNARIILSLCKGVDQLCVLRLVVYIDGRYIPLTSLSYPFALYKPSPTPCHP
jgi:hypothetical protein